MKNTNWNEYTEEEILDYLKNLPRYENNAIKSSIKRALFFFNLILCKIFRRNKPLFIVLVTNNSCNLNCIYCYGRYGERKKYPDYSTKDLVRIIDELKKSGTRLLTLHGGESLLRKDIGEIINYAKHKGFYISFNTNGYLVKKRINELKPVDTVCLSLDGNKESNDKNRGTGCFDKVIEAMDELKLNHIPYVISATLTRDNINDMEFLAKLAKEKNTRIQYSILYNADYLAKEHPEIVMSDREIRSTVKDILNLKKAGYPIYYSDNVLNASINWPYNYEETGFLLNRKFDKNKLKHHIPCYHGKLKYQIDADGRVVTCWAHDNADAPNIKELGVKEALKKCSDEDECKCCTFLANNEHNALMNLGIKNIWNILKIQVSDAFKIKKH